jgi:hypothetical protein
VLSFGYAPPAFCSQCGKAFPWTERKAQAAIELFLLETGFTGEPAEQFEKDVRAVARDTPEASVASNRIKRAREKVKGSAAGVIREMVVSVASEAVKQMLLP